jgi:hypothetical protein
MSSQRTTQSGAQSGAVPRAAAVVRRFFSLRMFFGVLRLSAYVFVVSLTCAALGARVVYANFEQGSVQMGRELLALQDVLASTKTIGINGAIMNISTALVDQSPAEVLDRFEAMCREHPDFLARALADLPAAAQEDAAKTVPDARLRLGIFRHDTKSDGALTCFTDDGASGSRDVLTRLRRFARSRDLSVFGRYRYVFVNRTQHGQTHVTAVWTNGPFNLGEMFPASGDAPGDDSALAPRPPAAKRTFSAAAARMPFGVRIYESTRSEADIRRFYADEMAQRGWALVGDRPAEHSVAYMKGPGALLYLSMVTAEGRTVVTTTETARADTPAESVAVGLPGRPGG